LFLKVAIIDSKTKEKQNKLAKKNKILKYQKTINAKIQLKNDIQ